MKRLIVAISMTVILIAVLAVSMNGQSPGLAGAALCLWTPVAWFVGYSFAKAGGKLRSPVAVEKEVEFETI